MKRLLLVTALLFSARALAESPADALARATHVFLKSLSAEEHARATFPFDDPERWHWFFVPEPRLGLPIMDMSPRQKEAAQAVLETALSKSGLKTVETIRKLENVLRLKEGDDGQRRNPDKYYFSVFGAPGEGAPWGLRFEGHHCSLNWTVLGSEVIASTPQFFGTNPAEVREGPMKGTRLLGAIEDEARALVKSLSPTLQAKAIRAEKAPRDILSGTKRQAIISERAGVTFSAMDAKQQARVAAILEALAHAQREELAQQRLERARKGGLDTVTFAWMGGLERGEAHYFSLQGDTFLVEYDNIQNKANHVHMVWRDRGNDFGDDVLKRHYETHAH